MRDKLKRIGIDGGNERLASIEEFTHRVVTVILGHFFSHSFSETFDGVEIRAVSWQWNQGETQRCPILRPGDSQSINSILFSSVRGLDNGVSGKFGAMGHFGSDYSHRARVGLLHLHETCLRT